MDSDDEQLLSLVLIFAATVYYNSLRLRSKLTRSAILSPRLSPWMHLLNHGDSSSFLEITGFTRPAFNFLRRTIFPAVNGERRILGRPRSLDETGQLGIYLLYLGSQMKTKHLCLIFGVVPTTADDIIRKMIALVCKKLKRHPLAEILFPDHDKMRVLAAMVQRREPMIDNVIGFVDGLSVPVQCSDVETLQRAAYNGYHHDTMCNNVFAFSPEGKVIYAATNFPGSWHDSSVASTFVNLVIERIGYYALCVDQGFPRSGELFDKFVGPLSVKNKRKLNPESAPYIISMHDRYISLRQASEWGMRALQGTFSRLKSRMTSNTKKRGQIILGVVLLNNLRTELVGLNQIATVFNHHYEQYINLETYDRIERYFNNV
jgi:DDE superfamily endonuclease